MKTVFEMAFDYLMQNEGHFVNDPSDSGGPTNFGVTQQSYEHYLGRSVTISELENLTLEKAKQFYFESFWMPLHCDGFTQPGVAVAIFDTAVLYGPWYAAHTAQEVACKKGQTLKLDGILGDKSRAAINSLSVGDFIVNYHVAILERIELVVDRDSKNERFRNGWRNRANRLLKLINPITEDGPA